MAGKKFILLFLGLLLPVVVFIFLKMFGHNEFEVPLMHKDGVAKVPTDCNFEYSKPYVIHDSLASALFQTNSNLILINFASDNKRVEQALEKFESGEIGIIDGEKTFSTMSEADVIKRCAMLLEFPYDLVLVDRGRNIRGYYQTGDRDDLDRLKAELTIILKKY
jgi:hypothetical protein